METPSSTRRITRSQNKAAFSSTTTIISSSKKNEETEKRESKKTKQRTCLFDITNDSPIVGLASGNMNETPISSIAKQKRSKFHNKTPNSGEALLRSQVKNLLQKVEEAAVISKFLSFKTADTNFFTAPTPANTPQVLNFNGFDSLECVLESPTEDQFTVSKVESVISDVKKQQSEIDEKDIISRSLFLDFSDKSDISSPEEAKDKQQKSKLSSPLKEDNDEEDDASIWSIQVNASIQDNDENEEDELIDAFIHEGEVEEEGESEYDVVEIDELCEGMKNVSVKEEVKFMGKHIKFVYNSDDELVEEEVSGDVLHLKGLPTPKGKHLRFQDEDDE
ncbi:hypothetical protein vseg_005077 [Gypsophila vaccaria]